jgi:hypothetical protein
MHAAVLAALISYLSKKFGGGTALLIYTEQADIKGYRSAAGRFYIWTAKWFS